MPRQRGEVTHLHSTSALPSHRWKILARRSGGIPDRQSLKAGTGCVKVGGMDMRPEAPPEGKLIAEAAARRGLSLRKAAKQAGISYGRWRQIATGYQNVSPGEFAIVRAPGGTLAKMARVVGVTPEQLAAAGRQDAAEAMQDAGQESASHLTLVPVDDVAAERRRLADQWAAMVTAPVGPELREVRAAIDAAPPGASGHDIFPDTPALAEIWSMKETPPQYKVLAMAVWLFTRRDRDEAVKAG